MTETGMPFADLMGVEITEREKTRVVGRLTVRDDLCTSGGILHGGAYMAFADSLPHASIERFARNPSLLKVDGELRECSYLVCGVRGLAGLGSLFRDDPAAFTSLMIQVLTPLM